jgi:uncharacterized membrane protein
MDSGPVNRSLVDYTHWIYGLHALSVVIGVLSARSVATRFAFGLPSIVAVIMNYARRSDARGTWLESHFRWQIRTFWFSWLWILVVSVVAAALLILLVGFVIAIVGYALIGAWIIYRVARGWLALRDGRPMPLSPV